MLTSLQKILSRSLENSLSTRRLSRRRRVGSGIDVLESRVLLSAATWTGGGGDLNWTTANNWSTHAVPGSADDVTISVTQGTTISGPSSPTTVHSLTISSGILKLNGSAFEVTNGVSISNNQSLITNSSPFTNDSTLTGTGTLNLVGSTVNLGNFTLNNTVPNLVVAATTFTGSGTLTIPVGGTLAADHATFNVPVVNQGTMTISTADFTNTTFNSTVSNAAGAHFNIVVNSSGHGSAVTVVNGFTNSGTISLEGGSNNTGSTLNVTKQQLINGASGVITFAGVTGAPSTINANVLNQGTINVPASQTYRVGTSNTFTNTATLTGAGTIDFTSCPTINLGALTITSSVPELLLSNTTLIGTSTVTIAAGVLVSMDHCTVNAPLSIKGGLDVITQDFTNSTFNGALSISSGGSFNLLVNGAGHGSAVTVANGFTNSGTISLEAGSNNTPSTLNVTNGILTNAAPGVITFAGVTGAASIINANLLNQGTINVPASQIYRVGTTNTFTNTATITGAGTIDFTSCPTINLGAFNVTSSVPTMVLTNTTLIGSSTITVAAGVTVATDHSTFNAPVTVAGTLNVSTADFTNSNFNGALSILAGANFNLVVNGSGHGSTVGVAQGFTNSGTISLESGSSNNTAANLIVTAGTLTNAASGKITFAGAMFAPSTITGNLMNLGTILVPTGQSFKVSTSNLFTNRATLSGPGTIDFTNCGNVDLGALTISSAVADLNFYGTTLIGSSTLTIQTGFTQATNHSTFNVPVINKGSLEVATNDFTSSTFAGQLQNLAGAHFDIVLNSSGHGSSVTVSNGFVNLGAVTLQAGTGSSATLNVTQGTLSNTATGSITSQGPLGTANILNGNLNNGGTININSPLTYSGLFATTGTINIGTTQKATILGAGIQKAAVLYPPLATVVYNGSGTPSVPQTLEALSVDEGALAVGFTNHSVFGTLSLANNTYLKLVDQTDDDSRGSGAEAVYANTLNVPAGTTLDLNGLHLYATVLHIQGIVLNGTVTQVVYNHAPIGAAKTVTILEDASYVLQTADFGFTDPNDSPANTLLGVKITTLPTTGGLTDNGVAVTAGATVPVADISGGKLKFTSAPNVNGAAASSFSFQVVDNGGTANGGSNTDPNTKQFTFSITSVNDAPVGTSNTVTSLEDAAYVIKTADFGFTDPNDTPANSLLNVKINTLPGIGSLKDNGVAVTVGQVIPLADITGSKLVFQPTANLNGGPYFLIKFQVQDNGGTANGGVDTDPTGRVMYMKLTPVNDAPTGASHTVAMTKNTSYAFAVADFGFSDATDSPANTLLAVQITTLPTLGSLTDNGVAVTVGQRIAVADITSGKLKYTPVTNGTGVNYSNFTFKVQDNGGTANGGIDTDLTARTMTFNVS